jgi:transposase
LVDSQAFVNERILRIDSLEEAPMPKPYSQDLRMRVVEAVEGGASRREVAELYGISPSVVVIWMQRWEATGSIDAKQSGGSVSPLDEHAEFLIGLTVDQSDMTLDEIVAAMSRAGIAGSRTAVWRFYERHDITYKKNVIRSRAKTRRCGSRAPTLDARAGHVRPGAVGLYR